MPIGSVIGNMPPIISGLRSQTSNFDGIAAAAKQFEQKAAQRAAEELMYELRGENDIIELETNNGEVGQEATELAKGA